jgi:hypothetical protein
MLLAEGTNLHTRVTHFGGKEIIRVFWVGFGFPHNQHKQDELPPPYPQLLCPISPWQHLPWYQIMAQGLPISLSKAPGGGSQLPRLVPLLGAPKHDTSRNREMGGAQALGGCQSLKKCNNQPKDSVVGGGIV